MERLNQCIVWEPVSPHGRCVPSMLKNMPSKNNLSMCLGKLLCAPQLAPLWVIIINYPQFWICFKIVKYCNSSALEMAFSLMETYCFIQLPRITNRQSRLWTHSITAAYFWMASMWRSGSRPSANPNAMSKTIVNISGEIMFYSLLSLSP